jgi:hypothetical protein
MRKSMKGMTSLLVIFAAVVVIGMLFFTKQNVVSGFANMVATKAAAPSVPKPMPKPKAPKPMPKPSMPSAPKAVAAAPLRR